MERRAGGSDDKVVGTMEEKEDGRKVTSGYWLKQLSVDKDGIHLWCGEAKESSQTGVLTEAEFLLALSGILSLLAGCTRATNMLRNR